MQHIHCIQEAYNTYLFPTVNTFLKMQRIDHFFIFLSGIMVYMLYSYWRSSQKKSNLTHVQMKISDYYIPLNTSNNTNNNVEQYNNVEDDTNLDSSDNTDSMDNVDNVDNNHLNNNDVAVDNNMNNNND